MKEFEKLNPSDVFGIFKEITEIPHGSGNMRKISDYCVRFAEKNNLRYVRDEALNVVIYKEASVGYENSEPVILQGHLDMVCQKTADCDIDFEKEGLSAYVDGDCIAAEGTSLGADNAIAVAMIMALLSDSEVCHPPIEAVFTTDEEIGLIGAAKLDKSLLSAKRMINIDAEEDDTLTVSCAGGSDFLVEIDIARTPVKGCEFEIILSGLKGGHSGVEIHKGRINANILAGRILNHMKNLKNPTGFSLISVNGGDKSNAITNRCVIKLCADGYESFNNELADYLSSVKNELSAREPDFCYEVKVCKDKSCDVIDRIISDRIIHFLACVNDGVMSYSAEIDGLVETSQNMGVLKTDKFKVSAQISLRSNKASGLEYLVEKNTEFAKCCDAVTTSSGFYPPWEYKADSQLREIYKECFKERYGKEPKVEAIHAGLECSVFSAAIDGLDCIAMGPQMWDVHTTNERLSVSSTENTYKLLLDILKKLK